MRFAELQYSFATTPRRAAQNLPNKRLQESVFFNSIPEIPGDGGKKSFFYPPQSTFHNENTTQSEEGYIRAIRTALFFVKSGAHKTFTIHFERWRVKRVQFRLRRDYSSLRKCIWAEEAH
jgi:hypothetical protein